MLTHSISYILMFHLNQIYLHSNPYSPHALWLGSFCIYVWLLLCSFNLVAFIFRDFRDWDRLPSQNFRSRGLGNISSTAFPIWYRKNPFSRKISVLASSFLRGDHKPSCQFVISWIFLSRREEVMVSVSGELRELGKDMDRSVIRARLAVDDILNSASGSSRLYQCVSKW